MPKRRRPAAAAAAWSLIDSGSSTPGVSTVTVSVTINTVGASVIIVGTSTQAGGTAPTDSNGNVYTLTATSGGASLVSSIWRCDNPITSPATVITYTLAASYPGMSAAAFAGNAVVGVDSNGQIGAGNTVQPGPVTTINDNVLMVTHVMHNKVGDDSIDEGYAVCTFAPFVSLFSYSTALAWKIKTPPGITDPTWTKTDVAAPSLNSCIAALDGTI